MGFQCLQNLGSTSLPSPKQFLFLLIHIQTCNPSKRIAHLPSSPPPKKKIFKNSHLISIEMLSCKVDNFSWGGIAESPEKQLKGHWTNFSLIPQFFFFFFFFQKSWDFYTLLEVYTYVVTVVTCNFNLRRFETMFQENRNWL